MVPEAPHIIIDSKNGEWRSRAEESMLDMARSERTASIPVMVRNSLTISEWFTTDQSGSLRQGDHPFRHDYTRLVFGEEDL